MKSKIFMSLLAVLLVFSFGTAWGAGQAEDVVDVPLIGFITNGPYEFWTYSAAAIEVVEQDYNVEVDFLLPPTGLPEEQIRFIESLIARGVDGIGISVIDPDNLTPFLNDVMADGVPMVMFDSDAPDSDRLAYVGMSNYAAGRMAGETVREVLPDGGEFLISVGRLDAQNAIERRQGIIDELNEEEYQVNYPGFMTSDRPNIQLGPNNEWVLLDTMTDGGDQSRAKSNAEDAILRHEGMDLIIGMWSYSGPAVISAVEEAGLLGELDIITFDQETEVLQGVQDGHVYATLGQNPFQYAVETIRILAQVARGEDPGVPADGLVDVPGIRIDQDNIDEMWEMYRQQLEEGEEYIRARDVEDVS